MGLFLRNNDTTEDIIYVFGEGRDAGPGSGGNYRYVSNNHLPLSESSLDRTQGWHKLQITTLADEMTFRVDDQVLYSQSSGIPIRSVDLTMFADASRPAFTTYFDDFHFVKAGGVVPEPSSWLIFAGLGIAVVGHRSRRRIRLPCKDSAS